MKRLLSLLVTGSLLVTPALAAQTVSAVTLMSMLTLPVFAVAARQLSGLG